MVVEYFEVPGHMDSPAHAWVSQPCAASSQRSLFCLGEVAQTLPSIPSPVSKDLILRWRAVDAGGAPAVWLPGNCTPSVSSSSSLWCWQLKSPPSCPGGISPPPPWHLGALIFSGRLKCLCDDIQIDTSGERSQGGWAFSQAFENAGFALDSLFCRNTMPGICIKYGKFLMTKNSGWLFQPFWCRITICLQM